MGKEGMNEGMMDGLMEERKELGKPGMEGK